MSTTRTATLATLLVLAIAPAALPQGPSSCQGHARMVELGIDRGPSPFHAGPDVTFHVEVTPRVKGTPAFSSTCTAGDYKLDVTLTPDDGSPPIERSFPNLGRGHWRQTVDVTPVPAGRATVDAVVEADGVEVARESTALVVDRTPDLVPVDARIDGDQLHVSILNAGDWTANDPSRPGAAPAASGVTRADLTLSATSATGGGPRLDDAFVTRIEVRPPIEPGATRSVAVPLEVGPWAGPWQFTAVVTSDVAPGRTRANDALTWTRAIGGPDLAGRVERFEHRSPSGHATPCPATCPPGRPVRAVVRAEADPPADVDVRLTIDGRTWQQATVASGTEWASPWTDAGVAGTHRVVVEVDPHDAVVERDEANNAHWLDLRTPDPNAPQVVDVTVSEARVREGTPVTLDAWVVDDGSVASVRAELVGGTSADGGRLEQLTAGNGTEHWRARIEPRGIAGPHEVVLYAVDASGNRARLPTGVVVDVEPWPTRLTHAEVTVNGEDREADWEGSLHAPRNRIRFEAEVVDHGHDRLSPIDVSATFEGPGGVVVGSVHVRVGDRREAGPSVASEGDGNADSTMEPYRADPGGARGGGGTSEGTRIWIDSAHDRFHLPLPGAWTLAISTTDVAGRIHVERFDLAIHDPDGAPEVRAPRATWVDGPGAGGVAVGATVWDALAVEAVHARLEHRWATTTVPLQRVPDDAPPRGMDGGTYRVLIPLGHAALPASGPYDVTLVAEDAAGNVAKVAAGTVDVPDGGPPWAGLSAAAPVVEVGSSTHLLAEAGDGGAMVDVRLVVAGPGRTEEDLDLPSWSDLPRVVEVPHGPSDVGPWSATLHVTDGAGTSVTRRAEWRVVPEAPPTVSSVTPATRRDLGSWWVGPGEGVTISLHDADGVRPGTVVATVGRETVDAVVEADGPAARVRVPTGALPHGAMLNVTIAATDGSGASGTAGVRLVADHRAPSVMHVVEPLVLVGNATLVGPGSRVVVDAHDADSGLEHVTVDGVRGWSTGRVSFDVTPEGTADGRLDVRAADRLGNSAHVEVPVLWDASGPTIGVLPPEPGAASTQLRVRAHDPAGVAAVTGEWSASGTTGTVALAPLGGGMWVGALPLVGDGDTTVAAAATDRLGNAAWSAPVTIAAADRPPAVTSTVTWEGSGLVVRWRATDPDTRGADVRTAVALELANGRWSAPPGATDLPATGAITVDPSVLDAEIAAVRVLATDGSAYDVARAIPPPIAPASAEPLSGAVFWALFMVGGLMLVPAVVGRRGT